MRNENVWVKVATDLPKKKPVILSLSELWPNAAMHVHMSSSVVLFALEAVNPPDVWE